MRSILLLATCLGLAATSSAQRAVFAVFPDSQFFSSSFIDRGSMNPPNQSDPGEILNEMPQGLVVGVGQDGSGACTITSLFAVLQDEEASTIETFGAVARPRDSSGIGPDPKNTIYAGGGLQTPTGLTGQQAWIFTITFTNPQTVPCDDYFHGIILPAAPNWTTDGLSAQMADYTQGTFGDNPRAGAPNLGWSIDSTTMAPQSHNYVWSTSINPVMPTIQVGANDPNNTRTDPQAKQGTTTFGAGGFYPDVSSGRGDGLDVRIYDANNPGSVTGVLFSFGLAPQPIPIAGVKGALLVDPLTMLGFAGSLIPQTAPEEAVFTFLPPNSIPTSLAGTGARVYFQGIVLDLQAGPTLTNAVGVDF